MKLKLIRNPEEVKKEIDLSTLERFIRNHTGHKSECIKKIYDDIEEIMKWPGFKNQIDEWLDSFNVKGIKPEYLIGILTIINSDLMWESSELENFDSFGQRVKEEFSLYMDPKKLKGCLTGLVKGL